MDEVKFVVADMNDLEFAAKTISGYNLDKQAKEILISPLHGIENLAEIAEMVSGIAGRVRLNLQLHKYIWGADARGV